MLSRSFAVKTGTTTPVFHNCSLAEPAREYYLENGDVLAIGNVEIYVEFVPQPIMKGKRARLATMKCVDPNVEDIPDVQTVIGTIDVAGGSYSWWIVERTRKVSEISGADFGKALKAVLTNIEAEYDATKADPNSPIQIIVQLR